MDARAEQLKDLIFQFVDYAEQSTVSTGHHRRGHSGRRFQLFLNAVGSIPGTRYLEVGVFNGSSLVSILDGNDISAVAIDIWDVNDPVATAMKAEVVSEVGSVQ